ncbi:hypothetical protein SODALDRAFT_266574 [Sodiomyces alkalinus F11]|uniref:Pre-rRNA processing protein n=1 Tax=Sodiomyces alkalinus (strain CBS 110278 / VKM F-3762 / F11) TaxID=1314773 RepID=A0A3N2Q9T5_SODAK|nr:hypothetical protein SODALDRAFT_266574 [Sodiomyces alkalinus F11]ROT43405.1 hypothetical protein SODALDRAFT_266574 [Sodiomyces alkalinus F11]
MSGPKSPSSSSSSSSSSLAPRGETNTISRDEDIASETEPLLSSTSATPRYDGDQDDPNDSSVAYPGSSDAAKNAMEERARRWPSLVAALILGILATTILLGAFLLPSAVEVYAKEAAVLEPTSLSLESITANGLRARIQASFRLDGSRVQDDASRRLGRFTTWVVRKLGTEETRVDLYLPDYDNALLGTAVIPPLVISLVDGETTPLDFITELSPGDAESYRTIANDWLEGKLDRLKVLGRADLSVKSGIIPLGTHPVTETLVLEAKRIPSLPTYNITQVNFRDVTTPDGHGGALGADISVTAYNDFPVSLDVPELGFQVLVPDCYPSDPLIVVADAITGHITVRPHADVLLDAHGLVQEIPTRLTRVCPNSRSSPLDNFLQQYLHGDSPTVYVRGQRLPESKTPDWISVTLSNITIPVPFPAHKADDFIRNFTLTNVHFKLPDLLGGPEDPNDDGNPRVSGNLKVVAVLPGEMNLGINVTGLRATADVFYKERKMGELNISKWQHSTSTKMEEEQSHLTLLKIESRVEDVPLDITDGDVFSEVIQKLFFGGQDVLLDVKANVDVKVNAVLGDLALKGLPAKGRLPVKHMPNDLFGSISPQVGEVRILDTSPTSIHLEAVVNLTNPTPYTAYIPYINVHVAKNGSVVGSATAEHLNITRGNHTNIPITAVWNPFEAGEKGKMVGKELLSQYLSGFNVTMDIQTHRDSIPAVPLIGEALSRLNISLPAPKLKFGDEEDDEGRFIRDATFHLFSSTATFTLVSPLHYNTIYIDTVNATAYYNHTEPVGRIEYDIPFAALPGTTRTPNLPVEWSVGSIGYDAVRKALGGDLQLDARANVTVRIGNWRETVWYIGNGIGAHIRF